METSLYDITGGIDNGGGQDENLQSGPAERPASGDPFYNNPTYNRIAHILSTVFNPLIIPFYAILILLYGKSVMVFLPNKIKVFYTVAILVNTLVIPGLFVGLLKSLGRIRSISLDYRRDRILPLVVTMFCYLICAYMVSDVFMSALIRKFLVAGAACVGLALAVTFFWKISMHMTAIGGALAMLVIVNYSGMGHFTWYIIPLVLCSGLLASARLFLGAHTPMQVLAGFVGGFVVAWGVMSIPWIT